MTTPKASTLLSSLFEHKAWANDDLFALIRAVDETKHATERHTCIRLLNHVYTVDQIFAAHLQRKKHPFTATNTTETPALGELAEGVAALDRWYVQCVEDLSDSALAEPIDFVFTDGKKCAYVARRDVVARDDARQLPSWRGRSRASANPAHTAA
jgi:uncharacterized damage-inducible protein DinB